MGLDDRDYMADNDRKNSHPTICPKTGHWIGVVICTECNYHGCSVRRFPFKTSSPPPSVNPAKSVAESKAETPNKEHVPEPTGSFWDHEVWQNKLDNNGSLSNNNSTDNQHKNGDAMRPDPFNDNQADPAWPKTKLKGPAGTAGGNTQGGMKMNHTPIPNWLRALLLIFSLSLVGLVINILIRSFIPFWLSFGFSFIFSSEKWFKYETKKHKWLGKLYRLILNVGILSLFGLLIWSGIRLFSHQFVQNALMGSILFVVEFVLFIWIWRVVSKNSWRWPSMKLTIFTLICLFIVFSFAGVQPLTGYKDTILNKMKSILADNQSVVTYPNNVTSTPMNTITSIAATTVTTITHANVVTTSSQTVATVQTLAKGINSKTGVYNNFFLGLVNSSEGVLGGDGCYDDRGDFIVLINKKNATDPTYAQLVNFLQSDKTDQYPYIYTNKVLASYYGTAESHVDLTRIQSIIDGTIQPQNPDVCGDFAERLHNEAEKAGIRCAYVSIDLSGYPDPSHLGIPSNSGHALDAFQTTDRGLVYVDVTGWIATAPHPNRAVSTVNLVVGQQYVPVSLFPEAGWQSASNSMGTVTNMEIFWDGRWNN
jgi:hypothetical protein